MLPEDAPAARPPVGPRWSTIRARVTALAVVSVVAVLTVTGAGLVLAQRRLLTENLEEALVQAADSIEAGLASGGSPEVLGGFGDDDAVGQVVDAGGQVLAATPNAAGRPPVAGPPPPGRDQVVRGVDGLLGDGGTYRLVSRRVAGPSGPVVHVAATLEDVEEATGVLVASLVLGVPLAVVVLGALIWWLVGRTLAPVEAIRAEVAGIGGTDLHRRVPEPAGGDEIARLARTMNAMLDRVEGAAARQQRFAADASHELRSPLTRIRSELEVDLAHPAGADLAATHRSVLEEAGGLQRLVEDLLHLARSDGGAPLRTADVDLDDLVLLAARRVRTAERVGVDTTRVAAAQVRGDADLLARALANLAENAERHAETAVTFTLAERDGVAVLGVADDGPGVPADRREAVFERFTRLDEARGRSSGGTGLGLAIARDIVERHGGTLAVDGDHHPGARFVITLPLGARS